MKRNHNDDCLHCTLHDTLIDWFERHGKRQGDQPVIDATLAIEKLGECIIEMTEAAPDRASRRRAFRYAHLVLDAALESSRTGKAVMIQVPAEN